uniref:Tectonic family member 1 n=1 Tax=Latimeria chalumnae TaxID=7897 RepID=H3B768_LATCH
MTLPSSVTNISNLCVCNLLVGQCDANCCCDSDCSAADFSTFSSCSIQTVIGDRQLCQQQAAVYSINFTANPPKRVFNLIEEGNPSVFCIEEANHKDGLFYSAPEVPTSSNFDSLIKQFSNFIFRTETQTPSSNTTVREILPHRGAQYGDPIETGSGTSKRQLIIPASVATSRCSDSNPAAFLVDQDTKCTRRINIEEDCKTLEALQATTYHNFSIASRTMNSNHNELISVTSITLKSLDGTLSRQDTNDISLFSPTFKEDDTAVCINIVLEVSYLITYTEFGEIRSTSVAFVLGAINQSNQSVVTSQQSFQIRFIEEDRKPAPLSGNPGYVAGLPLVAGYQTYSSTGIIQSSNRYGQLTILKSLSNQDCLAVRERTPVLFGYNMVSGCKLSRINADQCPLLSEVILSILKGQNFPERVAGFANAQTQNLFDWVQIVQKTSGKEGNCQIPMSLDIEVMWTKYGSLVNAQARIVNVTVNLFGVSLPLNSYKNPASANETTLHISSSVTFVDVSASAQPGYRAQPTIDAKLPFDFFYPFV